MIVDDGSTDDTPEILERLASEIPFLRILDTAKLPNIGTVPDRLATAAEAGHSILASTASPTKTSPMSPSWTVIPSYRRDTSSCCSMSSRAIPNSGSREGYTQIPIPVRGRRMEGGQHALRLPRGGDAQVLLAACFQAVGGIQERLGWDTIDEVYARMRGYRTRAYPNLVAHHHRPRASADGILRGRARHGECAYIVHFTLPWVTLRAFKMALAKPRGLSGVAFLYGYLRSAARRVARVEDPAFRAFARQELRERMLRRARFDSQTGGAGTSTAEADARQPA